MGKGGPHAHVQIMVVLCSVEGTFLEPPFLLTHVTRLSLVLLFSIRSSLKIWLSPLDTHLSLNPDRPARSQEPPLLGLREPPALLGPSIEEVSEAITATTTTTILRLLESISIQGKSFIPMRTPFSEFEHRERERRQSCNASNIVIFKKH